MSTLNGSFVPVLWWLHDAFAGYPFIAHKIPKTLGSNVHVCAVAPTPLPPCTRCGRTSALNS